MRTFQALWHSSMMPLANLKECVSMWPESRQCSLKPLRLVLGFAGESELVLRLAIRDLVDTEPLVSGAHQTRQVALNILDVVELGGQSVLDVNNDDFPVRLSLIEEGHDAKNLDLLDLSSVTNKLADIANVKRVVVTKGLGVAVLVGGVFPSLRRSSISKISNTWSIGKDLLGGKHHSSTGIPCGGSSCEQIEPCRPLRPARWG